MRLRKNQAGGFHFRRQHVIRGFIVDFYCHKVKLVIEVDGEIHRLQGENDQIRVDVLRSEGIMVQRFPNEKIKNQLDEVFHEIVEICNLRSGLGRNS
jgi:very-short-patch-repair endonuclease